MTQQEIVDNLQVAREYLAAHFIRHVHADGYGGVCAAGAIRLVCIGDPLAKKILFGSMEDVNLLAQILEHKARTRYGMGFVNVNDYFGKEQILKLFDLTIAEQRSLLSMEEPVELDHVEELVLA